MLWIFDGGSKVNWQLVLVQLSCQVDLLVSFVLQRKVFLYELIHFILIIQRICEELFDFFLLRVSNLLLFPQMEIADLI